MDMNKDEVIKYFLIMRDTVNSIEELSVEVKSVSLDETNNSYFSYKIERIKQNIKFLDEKSYEVETYVCLTHIPEAKKVAESIKRAQFSLFPVLLDVLHDKEWGMYSNICGKLQVMPLLFSDEPIKSANADPIFNNEIIDCVYNECNGKLWHNIDKEDFKKMLISGNISFLIKKGNRQRVKALLYRISFTIADEKAKSAWVANVERTLEEKSLSKIYELDETNSEPNKKFNCFLNSIYSK